ncbi:hypothetical protein D3C75_1316030 [compost metagenome]
MKKDLHATIEAVQNHSLEWFLEPTQHPSALYNWTEFVAVCRLPRTLSHLYPADS